MTDDAPSPEAPFPEAAPLGSTATDPATTVVVLGSGTNVERSTLVPVPVAGTELQRLPDGRLLAMAFRGRAVDLGHRDVPTDDDGMAELVLDWVESVRGVDWSPLRGVEMDAEDWLDLRTTMVRVGWGPRASRQAWERARTRPYHSDLPTAAGWAGAGWVVPAVPGEPEPAFAAPVVESRGLLRWAYMDRWEQPPGLPDAPLPVELEPTNGIAGAGTPPAPLPGSWSDVLSRLRADHYTEVAVEEASALAVEVLTLAGLGPRSAVEAEDEPLPDRDVEAACTHPSPLVRASAWFLLRAEADTWLACAYGECQHHWAVEAEEAAYEHAEVLELAAHGVASPVDAAMVRRRLLSEAFGDINDVPLAGSDPTDFIAFYEDWVAGGRRPDQFAEAVHSLRADEP